MENVDTESLKNSMEWLIKMMRGKQGVVPGEKAVNDIDALNSALDLLQQREDFSIGDIVVWKNGMRNRTRPGYGMPAIVTEVLNPPIYDESVPVNSLYYREPLTLRLGFYDEDGDFAQYLFDGRLFERYLTSEERLKRIIEQTSANGQCDQMDTPDTNTQSVRPATVVLAEGDAPKDAMSPDVSADAADSFVDDGALEP